MEGVLTILKYHNVNSQNTIENKIPDKMTAKHEIMRHQ